MSCAFWRSAAALAVVLPVRARPRPRARSTPSMCAPTRRRSTSPTCSSASAPKPTASRFPPRPAPTASSAASKCAAAKSSTNWAVFALSNSGDEQIDRLIVIPHYRMVGFGTVLARSRIVARRRHHAEFGRTPRAAGLARSRIFSASRSIPAPSSPTSSNCAPTSCRSSICGSRTPTRTRSIPSRSITASSSASPDCSHCS